MDLGQLSPQRDKVHSLEQRYHVAYYAKATAGQRQRRYIEALEGS